MIEPKKIVISRTDSIGDVVLTLPLAGILKQQFPDAQIVFLGNTYTAPIIRCSEHVDEVWEWAKIELKSYGEQVSWLKEQGVDTFLHIFPRKEIARLAKKANIAHRVGTSHRAFHLISCNHLVNFTRKRSDLHEGQLNVKLLSPLGIKKVPELDELFDLIGFTQFPTLPANFSSLLSEQKLNIILHPKSQGSAVEWGVDKFVELINTLDKDKYRIFVTGTEKESESFRSLLPENEDVIDLSGKMTLDELIAFIASSDALVAASTGPLHIAAVSGIHAIGLFKDVRPIHPGRWQPIGNQVSILKDEKNSERTQPLNISVRDVVQMIEKSSKKR